MTRSFRFAFSGCSDPLPIGQQSEHPTEEARRLVILFCHSSARPKSGHNDPQRPRPSSAALSAEPALQHHCHPPAYRGNSRNTARYLHASCEGMSLRNRRLGLAGDICLLFGQLRRTPSSKGPPNRFARQAAVRVQFATAVLVTTNFLVGRCTASAMASASRRSVEVCLPGGRVGRGRRDNAHRCRMGVSVCCLRS